MPTVYTLDQIDKQSFGFRKDFFGFEPFIQEQQLPKIKYYPFKELLFDYLREKNIDRTIEISFEGEGDSGQIYDIHLPDEIKNDYFYGILLRDYLENFGYEVLQISDHDWYNNDGGWGKIKIDPIAKKVILDISIRFSDANHYKEQY